MDVFDANEVKNRVRVRSIIIALIVYLWITAATFGIALILFFITATITTAIIKKEVDKYNANDGKFKKTLPLNYLGASYGDFEHVFYYGQNIEKNIHEAIARDLKDKTNLTNIEEITITDIDPDLKSPDVRTFTKIDSGITKRGSSVSLVFRTSNYENMQSIRWTVLAGGYLDKNKRFNKIIYSLFTLPCWIIPYIKNEYDILSGIRTNYTSYYNHVDIELKVKSLHEVVFQAMVDELEKHDIDTSELKTQRMQVMNISISGGKVNMGNVVQGAMNRVKSVTAGGKS